MKLTTTAPTRLEILRNRARAICAMYTQARARGCTHAHAVTLALTCSDHWLFEI